VPKFFNPKKVDIVVDVSEEDAKTATQKLAREEGVFAGMSSGGSVYCALQIAKQIDKGIIVAIICDRGDRYLSSTLFE
jgi:cysteine synthase B